PDLAQAQAVAERIRRATAEQTFEVPNSFEQARITLSIGGVVVNGQDATAKQLFEAAETGLARAKADGGNQIGFEAVHAAMLTAVPAAAPASGRPATQAPRPKMAHARRCLMSRWRAEHVRGLLFGSVVAFALAVRLAGRYVDRTLDSVRKLRTANEQLEHQAFHDPLTKLANRALFAERLEHARVRAGEGSVAVLFLDMDNFKTVNDKLGHAAGDALLLATTERLLRCVRREDTVARLGGDEFTVLLEDMRDPSDAARMAERIAVSLQTPFDVAGQQVLVSSSIGIALDTDRSHRPDDLLREADMAMYRAKSGGKARYEIFDTYMGERAMERLELETELRHAPEHGELVLDYQPVVSLADGSLAAVEAVLQWQHPRRGPLESAEFVRIAEELG